MMIGMNFLMKNSEKIQFGNMIELHHTLPPEEEYKMLTDVNNPYGTDYNNQHLVNWSNLYALGWIRGTYYKVAKFTEALRKRGLSDSEIYDIVGETVEPVDYRCKPQYHMITGQWLKMPEDCAPEKDNT